MIFNSWYIPRGGTSCSCVHFLAGRSHKSPLTLPLRRRRSRWAIAARRSSEGSPPPWLPLFHRGRLRPQLDPSQRRSGTARGGQPRRASQTPGGRPRSRGPAGETLRQPTLRTATCDRAMAKTVRFRRGAADQAAPRTLALLEGGAGAAHPPKLDRARPAQREPPSGGVREDRGGTRPVGM